MICPDWSLVEAAGDELLRPGSRRRKELVGHAAECAACRRRLLRLDPSIAIGGASPASLGRAELDLLKRDVFALARLRGVEQETREHRRSPARIAAIAALTVGVLLFAEDSIDRTEEAEDASSARVARTLAPAAATAVDPPASPLPLGRGYRLSGSLPLVESLEPSAALVFEVGRDDFPMSWIVDDSIEVPYRP